MKAIDAIFLSGAVLMIWRAGLNISADVWHAPDTRPSASPDFTIMIPNVSLSFAMSSFAISKVMPFLALISARSVAYLSISVDLV